MTKRAATGEQHSRLGLEIFKSLRSEDEPWLADYFLPPEDFEQIAGPHSVLVFGEPGSGKTAVFRMLRAHGFDANHRQIRLLVDWQPDPLPPDVPANLQWVRGQTIRIAEACAITLASYLSESPSNFGSLPDWARNRLVWFIQETFRENLENRLGPIMYRSSEEGASLLRGVLSEKAPAILSKPSPEQMIAEMIDGLRPLEIQGVWVISDDLNPWADTDPARLSQSLAAFLSTLSLFEKIDLAFKFCLPAHLSPHVLRASIAAHRRIDVHHLHWDNPTLVKMIEKRLALIFGEGFTLGRLCKAETLDLQTWFERAAGLSPRDWLDQVQPLVEYYLQHKCTEPIDVATWKKIRKEHPPRFFVDEENRRVQVGGRIISLDKIPPKAYDVLLHLYRKSGSVVGKDELYYHVYRGLDTVPRSVSDKDYEIPANYTGLIDTNIYRLRQEIEPVPSEPVLIQTVRGHGICLVSRW